MTSYRTGDATIYRTGNRTIWAALGIMALSVSLSGQAVDAPVLGYVFDAAVHGVRTMWGVPGAATIGDPLQLGVDVFRAAVSPRQNYILMLTGPDREAALFLPKIGMVQNLAGVPPGSSRIVMSPEGDSAAFYFPANHHLQVITGLPDVPAIRETDLPDGYGADALIAIGDDGTIAVATSATPEADVISTHAGRSRITLPGPASAVTFLSRSHAAVFTTAIGAVMESDVSGASTRRSIGAEDFSGVTAVTASADGQHVLLTKAESSDLTVVSLSESGTSTATLDCRCALTGAIRINGTAAWQLSDYTGEPLALLDLSSGAPRVVLVPPAVEGSSLR
jgi:hypothetical protein